MEVLFFRAGKTLYGLATDQIKSLDVKGCETASDLGKLLGGPMPMADAHSRRCVLLRGDKVRRVRIGDVMGIQAIRPESISPLPWLLQKKMTTTFITGVIWYRDEGALLLDLSHVPS